MKNLFEVLFSMLLFVLLLLFFGTSRNIEGSGCRACRIEECKRKRPVLLQIQFGDLSTFFDFSCLPLAREAVAEDESRPLDTAAGATLMQREGKENKTEKRTQLNTSHTAETRKSKDGVFIINSLVGCGRRSWLFE